MTKDQEAELIKMLRDKTPLARFGIPEVRAILDAMKAHGYEISHD